jgi:hypothetical protein
MCRSPFNFLLRLLSRFSRALKRALLVKGRRPSHAQGIPTKAAASLVSPLIFVLIFEGGARARSLGRL